MKKKPSKPERRIVSHNVYLIESEFCETCIRGYKVMATDGSYSLAVDFVDGVIVGPKSRLAIEVTVREEPMPKKRVKR